MTNKERMFEKGRRAGRAGKGSAQNPNPIAGWYGNNGVLFDAWEAGRKQGVAERKARRED